ATTETYTLSLHDALPISRPSTSEILLAVPGEIEFASTYSNCREPPFLTLATFLATESAAPGGTKDITMSEHSSTSARESRARRRSEEHTSELQSRGQLVC